MALRIRSYSDISLSAVVVFVTALIYLTITIIHPPSKIISWDVFGYYLYLPGIFIYKDIGYHDISVVQKVIEQYGSSGSLYQLSETATGAWVNKYPMGMALLYLPWFFIGHLLALSTSFTADGFSLPYQYSLIYGSMFYVVVGLYFLRKVLREFLPDSIVALVIIVVYFATNYFNQVVSGMAMPHIYLFTLYAVIMWLTIRWHKKPEITTTVMLAIAMGLCILSRPSEIVCLLIPALWGVASIRKVDERFEFFLNKWKHLFVIGVILLFIGSLQFFYWKYTVGKFFYNSYINPGEGFEFLSPFITQTLFSFRKGWFIYTPIMLLSVAGLYFAFRSNKGIAIPISLFFVLNLYIVSSWSNWWYGDSFGQRALIQSYAVMALPLGFFYRWAFQAKPIIMRTVIIFSIFTIFLNLFQTWQLHTGIIDSSRMSRPYYFATFFDTKPSTEKKRLLLVERSSNIHEHFENIAEYSSRLLLFEDFENPHKFADSLLVKFKDRYSRSGRFSYKCDSINIYSPVFGAPFEKLTKKDHAWIRIHLWVYPVNPVIENPGSLVVAFEHEWWEYKFRATNFEDLNLKLHRWNHIQMDYLTPEVRNKKDLLRVYYWHRGKKEIYIDDLMIEIFEPLPGSN